MFPLDQYDKGSYARLAAGISGRKPHQRRRRVRGSSLELAALVPIFTAVFIAELGDKTQLSALALSAGRGSRAKLSVFAGASLALVACSALAAIFGGTVSQFLGPALLAFVAGGIFLAIAFATVISGEESEEDGAADLTTKVGSVFAKALTVVFFAEMGDKTQIATAGFAAQTSALSVFVAASLALIATTAIGVGMSSYIEKVLSPKKIKLATVAIFGIFGVVYLYRAYTLAV